MNEHHFTTDEQLVFSELVNNNDAQVKYIYPNEFINENPTINIDRMNIDDYVAKESPLLYHVYND